MAVTSAAGKLMFDMKLVNERELLRLLGRVDNEARKEVQRDIVRMAGPMVTAARRIAPATAPTTGWSDKGRLGWRQKQVLNGYRVKFGGRGFVNQGQVREFPLMTLEQRNAAGAVFDWAGRSSKGKTRSGRWFIVAMANNGWGLRWRKGARYSRVLFPAYVDEKRDVIKNIQGALDKVARDINRKMR